MSLTVHGSINIAGEIVVGKEYTIQVDDTTTLKMVVSDAEAISEAVVLKDLLTGCTIVVNPETGEVITPGKNPLLAKLEFEAAMQRCSEITNAMVNVYKKSLG